MSGYNELHTQLLLQDLLDEMVAARSDSTTVDERLTTIESTASTLSGKVDTIESTIPTTGIYHASNYSSFAAAVTAIGSTVATLVVANSQTITASLDVATLAPNTTVVIIGGGYFTGESAVTLNLGMFDAPRRQVFYGLTVTFSAGGVGAVKPEWWGIDGIADEVQINQAITAAANVKAVELAGKSYTLAAGITNTTDDMSIFCESNIATLTTAADIDGITSSGKINLRNLKIINTGGSSTKAGLKFTDGAKASRIYNVWSTAFAYGLEMSSSTITGIAYNDFYGFRTSGITSACIYIHLSGSGWVNENHFFGGSQSASTAGRCVNIADDCNQNVFISTSFEGGNPDLFAIVDHGENTFLSCRFECNGHGFYVHGAMNNQRAATRIIGTHWSKGEGKVLIAVVDGRCKTDTWFDQGSCDGYVAEGDVLNTTVDQNSASGQKVLYLAATTNLFRGSPVVIDEGGDDEEWNVVDSVTDGVSVTLEANLANTHSAADAHVVSSHGKFYGQATFPEEGWQYVHYFAWGERLFVLDANSNCVDVQGTLKVSGTQVVGAQQTGVSAMTNLTAPANLDADTVTTAELADIVGNLINKLRTHGLVVD